MEAALEAHEAAWAAAWDTLRRSRAPGPVAPSWWAGEEEASASAGALAARVLRRG